MIPVLRRQQILNAVLLGAALALVVLVLVTRERVTTSEEEARSGNLLQVYRESQVTRLEFERKEGAFTLVRSRMDDAGVGMWSLKEPMVEEAEPFAVQKIMGTLEFASALRRIKPEEVNRAAFGLDSPELVVHATMGEVKYRLRFGKEAASPAGARYLEIAGEGAPGKGIVLISKSLAGELDVKVDEFREKYVMPYLSTVLDHLVIEGAGGMRKLRRGAWKDGWRFDGMLGDARTNRAALDRVLVQFARTRADRFIDPGEAEKSLASGETVKVTMTPSSRKDAVGVVEIGGKCPGNDADVIALRRQPDRVAACVPSGVLAGLTTPADALVDRTLFWMRPDEVEGFEVKQGEDRLALDRKESGFVLRAPREGSVDAEAGNGRLEAVLHATGVVVPSPDRTLLGLDPPHGSVVVRSAASEESRMVEERVQLSAPTTDGKVYAERSHDGVILEIDREAARALVADAALVRSRTILDVAIADVARVEIDGAPRQVLARAESGMMTLETPPGFEADGALALELCDAMRRLTAERWVADKNDGSFGLEAPALRVKLSVRKDGKIVDHVVRLGRPAASGFYASMEDDPGVFVVARRLRETFTTLVLDRSLLMVDPSVTSRITFETADRTVVLQKRGEDFVQTGPGVPLSVDAVRKLTDTLAALRVEAAIGVGQPGPEQGLDHPVLTVRVEREPGHAAPSKATIWRVGAGDSWRGVSIHYARVDGTAATYALARSNVRALLDAL